ncbi:hypothetical protein C2S51_009844 [Perilla frutescens var. frutescens]|nr:hypothetical protein C2S51_009844 [Perilla frutescens var. frutescens]
MAAAAALPLPLPLSRSHSFSINMVAFPDMALLLWYSFGTIAALLQSNPTDIVMCLHFYSVASHRITKKFTRARIPVYLCSLSKNGKFKDFEHARIATLGVVGALVKVFSLI